VGPRLGVDPALEVLLDPVVADGRGGVEPVADLGVGEFLDEPGGAGVPTTARTPPKPWPG
jgi:hypothetical protein